MYKSEEVQEIKQKIIVCVIVFLFIVILGLFLVFNRFGSDVDSVSDAIQKKESFVVFFGDNEENCDTCSIVQEELNSLGVSYYNFNVRASSYKTVLQKLEVDYEVVIPAVYVIENGEVLYNITDIRDVQTVRSFITENNILAFLNQES